GLTEVGIVGAVGGAGGQHTAVVVRVGGVRLALVELLVQQVVDGGIQGQIFRGLERAPQVQQGIRLGVAPQGDPDRLVGGVATVVVQMLVLVGETRSFAVVFSVQPQVQRVCGLPVQLGIGQVGRCIGTRSPLVVTALLLAVGIGVVTAQCPRR